MIGEIKKYDILILLAVEKGHTAPDKIPRKSAKTKYILNVHKCIIMYEPTVSSSPNLNYRYVFPKKKL